jgi:hypothetical protein
MNAGFGSWLLGMSLGATVLGAMPGMATARPDGSESGFPRGAGGASLTH